MQFDYLRRLEFITLLGGAAVWPLAARAQQPVMPVVGFMHPLGRNDRPNLLEAFPRPERSRLHRGPKCSDRIPICGKPIGSIAGACRRSGRPQGGRDRCNWRRQFDFGRKGGDHHIPIVFTTAGDPVQLGYVASLNRPGGNVTGINRFGSQLIAKGMGLLLELVPNAAAIALMANPKLPETARMLSDAQEAARVLGRQLLVVYAGAASEIDAAFATLRQQRVGALLVAGDPLYSGRRQQIVALAARDTIPAIYFNREFVADGGLMSYGNDIADAYRRAGLYVARILKGEKPADLPVDQATKFEFVINLKTAKALGLEMPPMLLARATEVIE